MDNEAKDVKKAIEEVKVGEEAKPTQTHEPSVSSAEPGRTTDSTANVDPEEPNVKHAEVAPVTEAAKHPEHKESVENTVKTSQAPSHTEQSIESTTTTGEENVKSIEAEQANHTATKEAKEVEDSIHSENEPKQTAPASQTKKHPHAVTAEVMEDMEAIEKVHWVPGIRAQFPWIGFSGIVCVLIAMALATAILVTSNGRRTNSWPMEKYPIAPNVLLNLVNQLSSLGLLTAITQGMAIAWWRKALNGGSLKTMHRNHSYSMSFIAVLTSGKHFNAIALAALMAKFAVIDSTLFQQATKVKLDYKRDYLRTPIKAWVGTEWPAGVGGIPGTDGQTRALSENFTGIINSFNSMIGNGKVHDNSVLFTGCPPGQTCVGQLDALGLDFNCSLTIDNVDYGAWRLQNLSAPPNVTQTYPLWNINFTTVWPTTQQPWTSIRLDMLHINTTEGPKRSCPGTLARRTCSITPAVVRYPITVLASTPQQAMNVTHISFSNSTQIQYDFNGPLDDRQIDALMVQRQTHLNENAANISTVGAITFALNNLFKSSASLSWSVDWDLNVSGSRAQAAFPVDDTDDIADHCAYTMDTEREGHMDPFIALVREMNNFAFVSAMYLDGAPYTVLQDRDKQGFPSTNFTTEVTGYVELYRTNYGFLAGALVATLFTVICVLPVYWQFWSLGRKVTLDPFDIANALSAPIFDKAHKRNGNVEELIDEVGTKRIKYGVLDGSDDHVLIMAEPERVVKPHREGRSRLASGVKKGGIGAVVGGAVAGIVAGGLKN